MPHGTLNVGEFKGYANGFEHNFRVYVPKDSGNTVRNDGMRT